MARKRYDQSEHRRTNVPTYIYKRMHEKQALARGYIGCVSVRFFGRTCSDVHAAKNKQMVSTQAVTLHRSLRVRARTSISVGRMKTNWFVFLIRARPSVRIFISLGPIHSRKI